MDYIQKRVLELIGGFSIEEPSIDKSLIKLGLDDFDMSRLIVLVEDTFNITVDTNATFTNGNDIVYYVRNRIKNPKQYQIDQDLKDKLVKYFTAIEDMADELTTGNVAHKKADIKGFAGRAKEYLIKHT